MAKSAIIAVGISFLMGWSVIARANHPPSPPLTNGSVDSGQTETPVAGVRHPRYRIRRGDSFDVAFAYAPEFNNTIVVQPDGYITLDGIGTLFVEGQTIPQLTETLIQAYAKIMHEPLITIALKDSEKPYFIASGQIGKPGKYDLRSDTTVTEAIAIAGGLTDHSKHSQVVVFRHVSDDMIEVRVLNIKRMLSNRDLREDVHLQPGDLVYVPQSLISKIQRFIPSQQLSMYVNPLQF